MKVPTPMSRSVARWGQIVFAIALIVLLLVLSPRVTFAFPVPELPDDNLIINPWFRSASNPTQAGFDGWTRPLTDGVTWGPSQKESNPSPDLVIAGTCGFQEVYCGTAARWAEQSGVLYPHIDVYMHQIVPADPTERQLTFFTYWVSHRVDVGAVNIYGSDTPDGPWTLLWVPLYHTQDEQIVPEGGRVEELWEETGFLERTLERGYPYYKVEFQSRLPESRIGIRGVGFKVTGVYFTTKSTTEPGVPPPTPGPVVTEVSGAGSDVPTSMPTTVATPAANVTPPPDPTSSATPTTLDPETADPTSMTSLSAEALSPTEIILKWASGEIGERGFKLDRSLDRESGWRPIARIEPGTTEYIDSGLEPGTVYYYRLRVVQDDIVSVISAGTLPRPEPPPQAPAALRIASQTATAIELVWQDLSTDEDGFVIERSEDGLTFTLVESVAENTISYTDGRLRPATYAYRVRSFRDDNYSDASNIVSVAVVEAPTVAPTAVVLSAPPNPVDTTDPAAAGRSPTPASLFPIAAVIIGLAMVGLVVRERQRRKGQ